MTNSVTINHIRLVSLKLHVGNPLFWYSLEFQISSSFVTFNFSEKSYFSFGEKNWITRLIKYIIKYTSAAILFLSCSAPESNLLLLDGFETPGIRTTESHITTNVTR